MWDLTVFIPDHCLSIYFVKDYGWFVHFRIFVITLPVLLLRSKQCAQICFLCIQVEKRCYKLAIYLPKLEF